MELQAASKKRFAEIDMLKIAASFMVVVLHVAAQNWYSSDPSGYNWQIMNLLDSMVRSAVPLFFMASGAVFLRRGSVDIKHLWLNNILHLSIVYIAWSVFYAVDTFGISNLSAVGFMAFITKVIQSEFHLWFIPTMIGIYILVPVLFSAAHYKDGQLLTYLAAIFFFFVILKNTILLFPSLTQNAVSIINKVGIELSGYSGYFLLGYWLTKQDTKKIRNWLLAAIYVVTVLAATFIGHMHSKATGQPSEILYGYFSLPVFIEAIVIFILFKNMFGKKESGKLVSTLSSYTLGVYLLHAFVYPHLQQYFGLHTLSFNPLLSIPIISIITFAICLAVIALLKQIPFVKKWLV